MRSNRVVLAVVAVAGLALSSGKAFADIEAAKGYVKEAMTALDDSKDIEKAQAKLELAETELDGEKPDAKAPVLKSIAEVKAKIREIKAGFDGPKYKRKLDRVMTDAEEAVGNLVIWGSAEQAAQELFADKEAQEVLGDQLTAAKKKFATFKKLHTKKAAVQIAAQMEDNVKQLEDRWTEGKAVFADADASPNSKASVIERTERDLAEIRTRLDQLPEDSEARKTLSARIDQIAGEFTKLALADRIKEVVEQLKRKEELYKDDWEGWEKESAGPKWADYRREQSEKMSSFFAPHTKVLIERFTDLLEHLDEDDDYKSVATAEPVATVVTDIRKKRDTAYAKMLSFVKPVVTAALAEKINEPNDWSKLRDDVRLALGEKSAEGVIFQAALTKKLADFEAATAGAEEARVKLIEDLRAKASAAWPDLSKGLGGESEVDVTTAKSGTVLKFTSDNLMGWRFKPGDFYFATTLGGNPVAAKIAPDVRAGIKEIEAKIGRSLGDDDNDGKWEVIAVVTGRKVKLQAKRQVEANGNVGGVDVKFTGEYTEPVEAVVIEIIAAKCGPFAGAKDKGVLKPDGSVGN